MMYPTVPDFTKKSLRELVQDKIWSARVSTGVFGLTTCPVGKRGPKEGILLASGYEGLVSLIDLGFVTCPVCKPEQDELFWFATENKIKEMYGLTDIKLFTDREVIPFDARRVNLEKVLPLTGVPDRFYVPRGLTQDELKAFRNRVGNTPAIGWYDSSLKSRFNEYFQV